MNKLIAKIYPLSRVLGIIIILTGLGRGALAQCNVDVGADTVLCNESWIQLTATPGQPGNYLYQWTPQSGVVDPFSQSTSAILNYNEPYIFTVTLTDTVNNCTDVDSISVISLSEINETIHLCDDSVYLEMPPGGTSYNWTNGGQTTQGIWVSQLGSYHGVSSHPLCGGLSHVLNVVSCFNTCSSVISYQNVASSTCNGDTIEFSATTPGGVQSWYWQFGDFQTSTDSAPQHIYANDGVYNVTLTIVDNDYNTCTSSLTSVFHGPFSVNTPDVVVGCQNCVDINSSTSYLGPLSYEWTDMSGNVLSTSANLTNICHADSDTFIVTITNAVGCTASDTTLVRVYSPVTDTFELCGPNVTLDFGAGADHYYWQTFISESNDTTYLTDTTQTFNATQTGTYFGYAEFPNCGALTSLFVVEDCSPCSNDFTYAYPSTGICGDSVKFIGTALSGVVASWNWNFDDGSTSTQQNPTHFFAQGSYSVTLVTIDTSGCSDTTVHELNIESGFAVNAGNDNTTCDAPAQLYAMPSVPSNYTYSWTPTTGLSDPTLYNPVADMVDSTVYTITLTDTASGCIAVDSVLVASYSGVDEELGLCGLDSVILDLGPGASSYTWQGFIDLEGDTTLLSATSQTFIATEAGVYFASADFPACGDLSSSFTVIPCTDSVWPGDGNNDGIANNFDLLALGISYGGIGLSRPNATINWEGQPAFDWADNLPNGTNYKYVDSEGNGVLNVNDTLAIIENYSLTHNKGNGAPPPGPGPIIVFDVAEDTVGVGAEVVATIHLGSQDQEAVDVYGLAFTVNFDPALVDTNSIRVSYANSWIGTENQNMVGIRYLVPSNGRADFATSRINHLNTTGFGPVATMRFITIDNLSGKVNALYETLGFTFADIVLVNKDGSLLPFEWQNDEVVIAEDPDGIDEGDAPTPEISIYPNPAANEVFIRADEQITNVRLFDAVGRLLETYGDINATNSRLDITGFAGGVYILEVTAGSQTIRQTLMVMD